MKRIPNRNMALKSKIDKTQVTLLPDEVTAKTRQELQEAMNEFSRELAKKLAISEQEAAKLILDGNRICLSYT